MRQRTAWEWHVLSNYIVWRIRRCNRRRDESIRNGGDLYKNWPRWFDVWSRIHYHCERRMKEATP